MTAPCGSDNNISPDVRAAITGYEAGQRKAGEAIGKAQDVARRASANGFAQIALGMQQLVKLLEQLAVTMRTMADDLKKADELTAAVPTGENPELIIARLSPAALQMKDVETRSAALVQLFERIDAGIRRHLAGGQTGPLLTVVLQIKQAAGMGRQHLKSAQQKTEEAIQKARRTGN